MGCSRIVVCLPSSLVGAAGMKHWMRPEMR